MIRLGVALLALFASQVFAAVDRRNGSSVGQDRSFASKNSGVDRISNQIGPELEIDPDAARAETGLDADEQADLSLEGTPQAANLQSTPQSFRDFVIAMQANAERPAAPAATNAPRPLLGPGATYHNLQDGMRAWLFRQGLPTTNPAAQSRSLGSFFGEDTHGPELEFNSAPDVPASGPSSFVVSREGVRLFGRAAEYYEECRRLADALQARGVNLNETLDVMQDSYEDVWAKLKAIQMIAGQYHVGEHNTHLENTLLWVDGILNVGRKRIAVHTHRVFFHPAADNRQSEINEGIKRVDQYLQEMYTHFSPGGKAEEKFGRIDQVVLVFDARYPEVKAHIRSLEGRYKRKFRFTYLDELTRIPKTEEDYNRELNDLVAHYYRAGGGPDNIIEGVLYSRYVGLLLELKTIEYLLDNGYEVLQSGRNVYDGQGFYVTELDAVAKKNKRVAVIEAKSARVRLPYGYVLQSKIIRKLDVYTKKRQWMNKAVGRPFDEVIFVLDVGRNLGLINYLKSKEARLSEQYGFPVRFVFIKSRPEFDRDRAPASAALRSAQLHPAPAPLPGR